MRHSKKCIGLLLATAMFFQLTVSTTDVNAAAKPKSVLKKNIGI